MVKKEHMHCVEIIRIIAEFRATSIREIVIFGLTNKSFKKSIEQLRISLVEDPVTDDVLRSVKYFNLRLPVAFPVSNLSDFGIDILRKLQGTCVISCAKKTFCNWVKMYIKEHPNQEYLNFDTNFEEISARANRIDEERVLFDYPICYDSLTGVWDEILFGTELDGVNVPTISQCKKLGYDCNYVMDIVIQHKGYPYWCIEIIDKETKVISDIMQVHDFQYYDNIFATLDLEWILKQHGLPSSLKFESWIDKR